MNAAQTLEMAKTLVAGDRAETHGDMRECHDNIAALWSPYLGISLTPDQVAVMMSLLKIARTKTGSHNPDDYVDAAAYLGIAGELK